MNNEDVRRSRPPLTPPMSKARAPTRLPALLLLGLHLGACAPLEDRPLYSRSRRALTGEVTTGRPSGAFPYPEELKRVRIGMSRREVYLLLGEPMRRLEGPQQVWLYGEPGSRQLILTFVADRLRSRSGAGP